MKSARFAFRLAAVLALSAASPAFAQNQNGEKKEEPRKEESASSTLVETMHEITVGGRTLKYKAAAGHLTLVKAHGEPRAGVFHVAYTKVEEGADLSKRPVCFAFNGGPGSSSVWLHLGAFGPMRVDTPPDGTTGGTPPHGLVPNEHTLLTDCDLVFIDPVSTGYSRAEKGEDPKQFHGYREDIESVGDFIRLWVTKNNRWGSPKFIMGESYGGIRGGGLARHLQDRYGMYLNGFIIVSGLLDFKTLSPDDQNDVPYLIWLPSLTAVAHYHKKLAPELQADFAGTIKRAQEFARNGYALALLKGSLLSAEERRKVAEELSVLTGLPADYILRQNLRINPSAFRQKLLEAEDRVIGRFDGRVVGLGLSGDPSYSVVYGAYATAINRYLRDPKGLNFQSDLPYEILTGAVHPWNYSNATNSYVDVSGELAGALSMNPALKVFIACGWHDLATPAEGIEYSVRHMDLPEELRGNFQWSYYDGGHMMYTNLPSLEKLGADVREFVRKSVP